MESISSRVDKYIFIVDERPDKTFGKDTDHVEVIFVSEMDFPEYYRLAFMYNIIEFNTAVKPWLASKLLQKHKKVLYLDPDTYVFDDLKVLFNELDACDFLLTPHCISDPEDSFRPDIKDFLRFGLYNLGFFGCRTSDNTQKMLLWWHNKLKSLCFYEPAAGLGVDQKFMDLLPVYFDEVKILKSPSCNLAFWNLHEREIIKVSDKYFVNGEKLIFAHFSSFSGSDIVANKQTRYDYGARVDFLDLLKDYQSRLDIRYNMTPPYEVKYAYDFVGDYKITDLARRRFYHLTRNHTMKNYNPFNDAALIENMKKKKYLIKGRSKSFKNFKDANQYSLSTKIIDKAFVIVLKLIGAEKYFLLCRYLQFISITLNQENIIGRTKK